MQHARGVQLTVLDLSGNNLSGPGMADFCEALPRTAMRRLRLSDCQLDGAACRGLAFFLDNTLHLEHLDLVRPAAAARPARVPAWVTA